MGKKTGSDGHGENGPGENGPGENEWGLWSAVTRSVKPYKAPKAPKIAPAAPAHIRKIKASADKASSDKPVMPAGGKALAGREKMPPKGFDRATETKLKRGQLPLEGRLDLHGMTQAEAFSALKAFIRAAAAQNKRTVLVITGKGRVTEGVLRQKLPHWLATPELACHVVAAVPARPKDGGNGAFYLRLRKSK